MNVGVLVVLACLASPMLLVAAHIRRDITHNRQIQRSPNSVANIRRKVAAERAEADAANAPTEVLPVIHPATAKEPTDVLPAVPLPRQHPYGSPAEIPPHPLPQPDTEVMARVLYGLHHLPPQLPAAARPRRPTEHPDSTRFPD
ncbi:hypothetical protein AB0J55_00225 [Amycolatopsis sp. NPDC049688]|uniref:hypothetical protein n=1 Tax=Amycolatopsis sp. NPDC049688 TaxID=3154733 RepID=UPI003417A5DF